ncbi:helix-turn-helix domain-containing protein [Streptomyces sp. NPDC092296]|uniref:helix-turn-helix domain-containing protein n=1 Tax=Streptomyces sp. NPDC092296 TaxID=3366012 RepID=UPI00382CCCAD
MSPSPISDRVAAARTARGLTQRQLATAAQVSLAMVRAVEQGTRRPGEEVLAALARALRVDPTRLTGSPEVTDGRVHAAVPTIRHAIDAYDLPDDGPVRPLWQLAADVDAAVEQRLASQYAGLAAAVPALIGELTRAVHATRGADRRVAAGLLTAAYRAADSVAYKYGYRDLSARLIELMRWAAGMAEDPLLDAGVAYGRTEVFFGSGRLAPGLHALEAAIDRAPAPDAVGAAAAVGALHMRAAVVAGRLGRVDAVRQHLAEAQAITDRVPEGVYHGTAMGPASLRVHTVAVAVELRDGPAALAAAREWAPPRDLPAERRSHYYIDIGRAQVWQGLREEALESLQVARRVAPQHVRQHPQVQEALRALLRAYRRPPGPLVAYAAWAGVT